MRLPAIRYYVLFLLEGKAMSKKLFDFVIGNPPYQDDRKGDSNTAQPVYHNFMEAACSVADAVELITPARFLFNAGYTPKAWNEKMLNDLHFKVMHYEEDASKVFTNTDIKGGVSITYHDVNKDFEPIGIFTIYDELNGILKKVHSHSKAGNMSEICFVASKFNMENLATDYPEFSKHERRMSSNALQFDFFHDVENPDDTLIYGVHKGRRTGRYIFSKYVDLTDCNISKYKIVIPKADGNGAFGSTLTKPEILKPNSGFTHTFLGIGGFDDLRTTESAMKYIKTKFARTLLSVLKITQDVNADKWKYVPLQDFTASSDIDWSKSIHEIDLQLYKKYGLSAEEIDFIETNVKEMA